MYLVEQKVLYNSKGQRFHNKQIKQEICRPSFNHYKIKKLTIRNDMRGPTRKHDKIEFSHLLGINCTQY